MSKTMVLTLKVWRQNRGKEGKFVEYKAKDVSPESSFLEMLDQVNEDLVAHGEEPIAFDHDCREGICGTCGIVINGDPHGPKKGITTCQLHMRHFEDGETLVLEPFRAQAFPVVKDLMVDRTSFDRIMEKGGYVSVNTGAAQDANSLPIPKGVSDEAFNSATCIGCGACVAACKNASALLFTSAKINHLSLVPQGQAERSSRVIGMIEQMDKEGFGACSTTGACEATCPKEISLVNIAKANIEYLKAKVTS